MGRVILTGVTGSVFVTGFKGNIFLTNDTGGFLLDKIFKPLYRKITSDSLAFTGCGKTAPVR